jgi:hypothetical protein
MSALQACERGVSGTVVRWLKCEPAAVLEAFKGPGLRQPIGTGSASQRPIARAAGGFLGGGAASEGNGVRVLTRGHFQRQPCI